MTTQLLNHASTPVVDGNLTPLGYEQITGLSTVKSLTAPNGARLALIQAEAQNVRYRDDGTDPDANTGMLVASGSDVWYIGDLSAVRLIETTASAKVNVSYYK